MPDSRWIDVSAADGGKFGAYLSLPPTGKGPGIVLIQEIFGVNPHIRGVADQYASDGYVVLAPDLFWRMKPRIELGYGEADFKQALDYMGKMDFPKAIQDIGSSIAALRALPECGAKVASLGYCMGGLLSFLTAAQGTVDAAVCYYGGGIGGKLAEAPKIKCPTLFHFAANDKFIPMAEVDSVKKAFAGRDNTRVDVYPGVDHGFNCCDRGSYDQRSAALARGRSLAFLATTIS